MRRARLRGLKTMRTTRIYVELELASDTELLLPSAPSAHLLRVLRLPTGATLTLFNGRGGDYSAALLGAEKTLARVRVGAFQARECESPLHLTLLQGVARGERMDFIIQKATELGVQRVVPLSCEFSVVRLEAAALRRRLEHWRAVAIAACEQCGRNRLPVIEAIGDYAEACAQVGALPVRTASCASCWCRTPRTHSQPALRHCAAPCWWSDPKVA